MKIKPAYLISLGLAVFIALWFIYGSIIRDNVAPESNAATQNSAEPALPSVVIERINAETHISFLNLHGSTEAVREVAVKAETAGLVVRTPVAEGRYVKRGTLLCQQDVDARQAILDQAKAQMRARELEYQAAVTLVEKGYRSSTQAASALAALDGARASVKQAEIEIDNVNMRAPFGGIFDNQMAEVGDYLAPGQACGLLVDLNPLLVVGEATERQIGRLKIGQDAQIELATGQAIAGKVRFIESRANPATRTFRIEVEVANDKNELKSGVTASVKLASGEILAHFIPSRVLTLDDTGRIGVRHLDANSIVRFSPVTTIDETDDGIWVTGLPDATDLIVLGQDYVAEGSKVATQNDSTSGARAENAGQGRLE
jgi:multidrug efflux system membrane fusion protein